MTDRKINWQVQTIFPNQSGSIPIGGRAVLFKNKGLGIVYINNYPLAVGESVNLDCTDNEIDNTAYKISFEDTTNGLLFVWRKIFVG